MLAQIEAAVNRRAWGQQEELLASVFDAVQMLTFVVIKANTPKKDQHSIPAPVLYPRPDVTPKKKRSWFNLLAAMPGGRR